MRRMRWIALTLLVMIGMIAVGSMVSAQETTPEPEPAAGYAVLGVRIAEDTAGARVLRVQPGSPAEAAGILEGDVITAVDGEAVTAETLPTVIAAHAPGDVVTLDVLRAGETLQLSATLGEAQQPSLPGGPRDGRGQRGDRGGFRPFNEERFEFGRLPFLGVSLSAEEGVLTVASVAPESPAANAGLQVGDQIISINGQSVDSVGSLIAVLGALAPGDTVTIEVNRAGETLTVETTLAERPMRGFMHRLPAVPFVNGVLMYDLFDNSYMVLDLPEDSALYAAGLRSGDRILSFDGTAYEPLALTQYLAGLEAGETVVVSVVRNGAVVELTLPAAELSNSAGLLELGFGPHEGRWLFFGQPDNPTPEATEAPEDDI